MKKSALAYAQVVERRESNVRHHSRWFPPIISSAKGSVLRDINGESYIDFVAGAGALNYGHNDPDLQALLLGYLGGDGIVQTLDMLTESRAAFLLALERHILVPRQLDTYRSQFTGAAPIAAALRLARKVTGRHRIISFSGSGPADQETMARSRSAPTAKADATADGLSVLTYDGSRGPSVDTATMLDDLLADPARHGDEPAAILVQTVHSDAGLATASAEWMRRVADIAARHEALLIVDDAHAGCGRTGTFFSFEPLGVRPDIIVLGTSLSGYGLPLSMLLIDPTVDQWRPGELSGTFRGNGAAFVTAAGALNKFWQPHSGFEADIRRRGAAAASRLDEMAQQVAGLRVRGRGMMLGLDVSDAALAERIQMRCTGHGLLIDRCGPSNSILTVSAPLTTPDAILDRGLEILHRSVVGAARAAHHDSRPRATASGATADRTG